MIDAAEHLGTITGRKYLMRVGHFWEVFTFFAGRDEEEVEHANMSRSAYRDYWREECATTDRGN